MIKQPNRRKQKRKLAGRSARVVEPQKPQSKARKKSSRQQAAERGTAGSERQTKIQLCIDLLRRSKGASIAELQDATGWQAHSLRGAISGTLKKKLGLTVDSERIDNRGRVYRIVQA